MAVHTILKKSGNIRVAALFTAFILSAGFARPGLSAAAGPSELVHSGVENATEPFYPGRQTGEEDVDENKLEERFLAHIKKYYFQPLLAQLNTIDYYAWRRTRTLDARLLGYFLGQQLKYVQRGSVEHKHWLILERRSLAALDSLADRLGTEWGGISREEIALRKEDLRQQFQLAAQGWLDPQMAVLTGVTPGAAPNFFESPEYMNLFRTDNSFLESLLGIWILRNYTPANDYEGMITWTYRFTREQAQHGYSIDVYNDQDNIKKGMAFWKAMGEYMLWMTSTGKPWVLFKRINYNLFYGVILYEDEIDYINSNEALPASMNGILRNWPPRAYYSLKRRR